MRSVVLIPVALSTFVSVHERQAQRCLDMKGHQFATSNRPACRAAIQSSAQDLALLVNARRMRIPRCGSSRLRRRVPGGSRQPCACSSTPRTDWSRVRIGTSEFRRPATSTEAGPVPRDASEDRRSQAHHGVPRFSRQIQRRIADAESRVRRWVEANHMGEPAKALGCSSAFAANIAAEHPRGSSIRALSFPARIEK